MSREAPGNAVSYHLSIPSPDQIEARFDSGIDKRIYLASDKLSAVGNSECRNDTAIGNIVIS